MKKKLVLVVALATFLAVGTAFASPVHPNTFGIGGIWGSSVGGDGGNFSDNNRVALSLKFPTIPIFWGIRAGGFNDTLWVGVQGDLYFMGSQLTRTLGWFLGFGAYGQVWLGSDVAFGFGGRLPIGLTWQPLQFLEFFGNIAPQIGGYIYTHGDGGFEFPHGGLLGIELGIRIWL